MVEYPWMTEMFKNHVSTWKCTHIRMCMYTCTNVHITLRLKIHARVSWSNGNYIKILPGEQNFPTRPTFSVSDKGLLNIYHFPRSYYISEMKQLLPTLCFSFTNCFSITKFCNLFSQINFPIFNY